MGIKLGRAALAAMEASEAIQAGGCGRLLVIRGTFDEFKSTWNCCTRGVAAAGGIDG